MNIIMPFLLGMLLIGSVGVNATAIAADDGLLLSEEESDYCHIKFRAIESRTLSSDNPTVKSAHSGDVIDFYGPCDETPTGQNQVLQEKFDRHFWQNAR